MLTIGSLGMTFLGGAYGMQQEKTLLDKIPPELHPTIQKYYDTSSYLRELEDKLDQAKSLEELEKLLSSDEIFKTAPVKLNLSKFSGQVTNDTLKKMVELVPNMGGLDLSQCRQITDDGLAHLEGLTNLNELSLYRTPTTDASLDHLKKLTQLKKLVLEDTYVTDTGLEKLENLTNLTFLNVHVTDVSLDGIKKFKEKIPNVTVLKGFTEY